MRQLQPGITGRDDDGSDAVLIERKGERGPAGSTAGIGHTGEQNKLQRSDGSRMGALNRNRGIGA